jgi:hypothetical protein
MDSNVLVVIHPELLNRQNAKQGRIIGNDLFHTCAAIGALVAFIGYAARRPWRLGGAFSTQDHYTKM